MVTSRGKLAEFESIFANIQAAIEHILDRDSDDQSDLLLVQRLRESRQELTPLYIEESQVDYTYWCAYKHLLLSATMLAEQVQAEIKNTERAAKLRKLLQSTRQSLHLVRLSLFQVNPEELEDPNCPKCLEDLMEKKSNLINQDTNL